jgi:hypothetical protein
MPHPLDILLIPAFYWHQVSAAGGSTISVNMFYGDAGSNTYIHKLLSTRREAFVYWILNIVQQQVLFSKGSPADTHTHTREADCKEGEREDKKEVTRILNHVGAGLTKLLPDLPRVLVAFCVQQFHETLSQAQTDTLVRVVLEHVGLAQLPAFASQADATRKHPPRLKIRGLRNRMTTSLQASGKRAKGNAHTHTHTDKED